MTPSGAISRAVTFNTPQGEVTHARPPPLVELLVGVQSVRLNTYSHRRGQLPWNSLEPAQGGFWSRLTPPILERRAVLSRMFDLAAAELTDEQEVLCRVDMTRHNDRLRSLYKSLAGGDPPKRFL